MNVLVLTPWYPSRPGETEGLFVKQQVHALASSGCNVVVVSPRPHWLPVPGRRGMYWRGTAGLPYSQIIDGIEAYFPRYLLLPRGIAWKTIGRLCFQSMRRLIERLNGKYRFDVIHGHEILPAGLSAPYLKNLTGLPFVLTVHGESPAISRFLSDPANEQIRQRMWHAVDRVAAVGTPLVNWLTTLGGPQDRVSVIPNGAEVTTASSQSPRDFESRFGRCRVILSVSNLYPTKGLDTNLKALKNLTDSGFDNLHYIVVGEGPDRSRLNQIVHNFGSDRNVTFLGRLPHLETLAYMKACEVFSLPSWQEAFGIVYVEAMAMGKPAIGCLGQGAEDIIADGRDGLLVRPQDEDHLAAALRRILSSPDFAARIGQAAAIKSREFSWQRNAQSYIELFQSVIGDRRVEAQPASTNALPQVAISRT
ncbi:MAG TPA: glycosyltransferase [Blastocatellia bacterium]